MKRTKMKSAMWVYFILLVVVSLGKGLSDSVMSNYFKDAYDVTAAQRGFLEFPRELPGMLCVVVISLLSSLGDIRTSLIAQILSCVGILILGLTTPSFDVMIIFVFVHSMGSHLFMPTQGAIGMSLAEPEQVGRRMGQYASVQSAVGFVAALLTFFGFRYGFFSFKTEVKWIFLVSSIAFAVAAILCIVLLKETKETRKPRKKFRLLFRKEYKYFYLLTMLGGVQKQITSVYGAWVVIEILRKGADVTSLLMIATNFICIFFMHQVGKWMDRYGTKRMMYIEAFAFIIAYLVFGGVVWLITEGGVPMVGVMTWVIYGLYIVDRISMQLGMVKNIYLQEIAWSNEEITETLSMGTSLDHVVSIIAAILGGIIWETWGSYWVFFLAAAFSLGNLYVAAKVNPEAERALALEKRAAFEKIES
ncbi:MAG: MFS transporter [Christensenellaceae bacterium]